MKNSGQDIFLPLFVLQLPHKTLARFELCQDDWMELLAVLLAIDINASDLNETLISLDEFCQAFRLALDRVGREDFLQSYVEDIRARHMGAVGLAMETAPTLDDSLAIWCDNAPILAPMLEIACSETSEERRYSIRFNADIGDIAETYMEVVLFMTSAIVRNLSGGTVTARVELAHAAQQPPSFYRDSFGLEPLFGQRENALIFRRQDTARANDYYAPLMYRQALEGIRQLRENIQGHMKLAFRVRQFLQKCADDGLYPSLYETAEHFNMAARTFTRHLSEEGVGFRQLRNETQLNVAKRLLRKSRLPIKAIADRAGFTNISAFSRAFHAANGVTPQEFRRAEENMPAEPGG